ncbi:hypothetical protein U0035_14550 [Niabella yanshanensis]|uniref:Glycosyl transferase family 1 domain-containing protein n=1 Tax=Niabella yanshanensis TaxID=577386 RepID=A0ABZ0W2E7_9BACT|nr:glycosyltransferase [Niabella yanshanensis]WQD36889.1 hypothetical protein U0035_14550 [Niabella yanshanensis]
MAIILDTEGISAATYRGYLARSLFDGIAAQLPDQRLVVTAPTDIQGLAYDKDAGDLPPQKGLFHQKKTAKWLQLHQVRAFISFKRMLKTDHLIRQVLIIAGEEQLDDEKLIRSAPHICIVSEGLNQLFNEKYPGFRSRIILIDSIMDQDAPDYVTADDTRETIASGREYFVLADFNLTQESLTVLLKGFSAFKRMLHSSWKFMVVLRSEETIRRAGIDQLLSNYKYRDDVIVTNGELLNEKLRDAYALVSMDDSERLPIPVIEAARVHTPAIVQDTRSARALLGTSVIYTSEKTSEAIGEMLMKMYKDENFRQTLIKELKGLSLPTGSETAMRTLSSLLT